ncbi:MAG: hypothetical protein ACI9YL_001159 [Luteibaculaceae bacterium]|jgi:hypothetical protein
MKNRIIVVLFVALGTLSFGQPKHFRAMYKSNPESSVVIGFSADLVDGVDQREYFLYYSENDHGTNVAGYMADNPAMAVSREVLSFKSQNHYFFRLENLKPKTRYNLVLVYSDPSAPILGQMVSKRYWVKTMSDNPSDPISIISGGDSRQDLEHPDQTAESITIRQEANRIVAKLRPDFVAFGGDYTFAGTPTEWRDWLQDWELTITEDGKLTPIVAAAGNHEYFPFGGAQSGSAILENIFDVPHPDVYYGITFGGNLLRLYTLNTEVAISGDQSGWLREDLVETGTQVYWKMAQYHKPIRPHEAGKSDLNSAYAEWAQAFFDNQVRLVFESDAHVVKTTYPVKPTEADDEEIVDGFPADMNFVRTQDRGIVFVGEGTWAALRDGNDSKAWTQSMGGFNQVKWVWVNQDSIELRTVITYDADNPNYINSISNLNENNRFVVPNNIQLWNPPAGEVVRIYDNGTTLRGSVPNGTPILNLPDSLYLVVDSITRLDLSTYASDPEGDSLQFWIQSNSNSQVISCAVEGSELVINAQLVGSSILKIVCSDRNSSLVDSIQVDVVGGINHEPIAIAYPILFTEGEEPAVVGVHELAYDEDGDSLQVLDYSMAYGNVVQVTLESSALTFSGYTPGYDVLSLAISDGHITKWFDYIVEVKESENLAPVWIQNLFGFETQVGDQFPSINLGELVLDSEGDSLEFVISNAGDSSIMQFEVQDDQLVVVLHPENPAGVATIEISVSDGLDSSFAVFQFSVTEAVGINEQFSQKWSVFPNPFESDLIQVESNSGISDFVTSLYTLEGALLNQQVSDNGKCGFYPQAQWPNVVVLAIRAEGYTMTKKILIRGN